MPGRIARSCFPIPSIGILIPELALASPQFIQKHLIADQAHLLISNSFY